MTTKLAEYLDENDISQAEFARLHGFKTPTLCQWTSAERLPGRDNALALERATHGAVPASYWSSIGPRKAKRVPRKA